MKKIPISVGLFITYQDVFDDDIPSDRLSIVRRYSKKKLLELLAIINLHPDRSIVDHSLDWNTQIEILGGLFKPNMDTLKPLFLKIQERKRGIEQQGAQPTIFSRVANVICIEEILTADFDGLERTLDPKDFLRYYLAINTYLYNTQELQLTGDLTFPEMYPLFGPMNEHHVPFYPILDLLRAMHLTKYIKADEELKGLYKEFYEEIGLDPYTYVPILWVHIVPMTKKDPSKPPIFKPRSEVERMIIHELAKREIIQNRHLFEAFNLKRINFYKWSDNDSWLLLDVPLLVENIYYLHINLFWFKKVKQSNIDAKFYFGKIGSFFERYISGLLQRGFHFLRHPAPKFLDDLKVTHPKTGSDVEIADFFIQQNRKIILGEIKSTQLAVNLKYNEEPIDTFKNNLEKFKKDYGIKQIARSIWFVVNHPELISNKITTGKNYNIFPVLVLSERLFQTPFSNQIFQELFENEMNTLFSLHERNGDWYKARKVMHVTVHPLTIWHSTDVEILEIHLNNRAIDIWRILRNHAKDGLLHRPFYLTLRPYLKKGLSNSHFEEIKDQILTIIRSEDLETDPNMGS